MLKFTCFLLVTKMIFSQALNVYWMSSNLITITQARIMSIPAVREKFGIPAMIIRKDTT